MGSEHWYRSTTDYCQKQCDYFGKSTGSQQGKCEVCTGTI